MLFCFFISHYFHITYRRFLFLFFFLQQSNVCNPIQSDLDIRGLLLKWWGERDCLWYISTDQLCYITNCPVVLFRESSLSPHWSPQSWSDSLCALSQMKKKAYKSNNPPTTARNKPFSWYHRTVLVSLFFLFFFLSLFKVFLSMHLFSQAKCINSIDKEKHLLYRIEVLWWPMWQFEFMYDQNKNNMKRHWGSPVR